MLFAAANTLCIVGMFQEIPKNFKSATSWDLRNLLSILLEAGTFQHSGISAGRALWHLPADAGIYPND
ncbi:MAG: hypothetical protein IMZ46_03735 [Acidobacteria bacterium]|nr:hypothetical protein [Acidobacteriota bacterium]